MRRGGKFTLALTALVMAASLSSATANEAGCRVQSDLTTFILETENFLDYLDSGEDRQAVRILERRLEDRSTSSLPQHLMSFGLDSFAGKTDALIRQQKTLMLFYRQSGRQSVAGTKRVRRARDQMRVVRKFVNTVPCSSSATHSAAGEGFSSTVRSFVEESAVHLIVAMAVLGGIAVGLFGWFSQIGQRRTKRHSCMIPCSLKIDDVMHPAMITNISRSGAKLNIDEQFERGKPLVVNFLGECADGRIIRHKNGQLAVNFDVLLHSETLDKALEGVTAASLTRSIPVENR